MYGSVTCCWLLYMHCIQAPAPVGATLHRVARKLAAFQGFPLLDCAPYGGNYILESLVPHSCDVHARAVRLSLTHHGADSSRMVQGWSLHKQRVFVWVMVCVLQAGSKGDACSSLNCSCALRSCACHFWWPPAACLLIPIFEPANETNCGIFDLPAADRGRVG